MSRDDATLLDIARAVDLALKFAEGLDQGAFENDLKTQSAVLHQFLLLGEAVKRLSSAFRQQHDHVPWRLIAGMRDHLIHQYDDIDLGEVWKSLEDDLPSLQRDLRPLLPEKPE